MLLKSSQNGNLKTRSSSHSGYGYFSTRGVCVGCGPLISM